MTGADPNLGHKRSREQSRRQSSRLSQRTGGASNSRSSAPPSHRPVPSPDHPASDADHERSEHESQHLPRTGRARIDVPQRPASQTASLLGRRPSQTGPNKLRKSQRRTDEIMREREIRALSSTPIDIPRRSIPLSGENLVENRRRKANGRRSGRYHSDISLSMRDSTTSSASDGSDPYTFKLNAFAALTPRPVVRYVEAPRSSARAQNVSVASARQDKERLQALTMSEENLYYSKRRVKELADSLDAGALRELMERDTRRREKKQLEDQEKLQRKLRERAEAQEAEERARNLQEVQRANEESDAAQRSLDTQDQTEHEDTPSQAEVSTIAALPEQSGSWLRISKGSEFAGQVSLESALVTDNIDDSDVRANRLGPRASFAPSHEMGMSRTTLSPSHSSLRQGRGSSSLSQTFGAGSTSDVSRLAESERWPSDTSGRRGNAISSLFRRGSSRLKRRYLERFQDSNAESSNKTFNAPAHASHDSFFRMQPQSPPPPSALPIVFPPKPFVVVKHSQSKFTEHFGDEPLSPPDSRLQWAEIPEQVPESSLEREVSLSQEPAPSSGVDIKHARRAHHRSLTAESFAELDNVPLSQSLASIDSEGSWMSGQFFRQMSQKPSSPVRPGMNSFGATSGDGAADMRSGTEGVTDDEGRDSESRPVSGNVVGELELENDMLGGAEADKPAETWHSEVGKRPVLVNPTGRPKSAEGMLKTISSLSEEDSSPEFELQRAASVKVELGHVDEPDAGEPGTAI